MITTHGTCITKNEMEKLQKHGLKEQRNWDTKWEHRKRIKSWSSLLTPEYISKIKNTLNKKTSKIPNNMHIYN